MSSVNAVIIIADSSDQRSYENVHIVAIRAY